MKSIGTKIAGLLAVAIAAAGLGAAAAVAQEAAPGAPAPEAVPAPSQQFEEPKLKSFAVAFLEVSKVNQEYQPQLQAATDPEEQKRIRDEAGGKMVEAVENTDGISVEEYSQIIAQAQTDPELAQQINTLVQEAAQPEQ
jgi:hypothetical protein